MEQLEQIKQKAAWHQERVNWYLEVDVPYSEGAAEYHQAQAKKYWNQYGRMIAELESKNQWAGKKSVVLMGV